MVTSEGKCIMQFSFEIHLDLFYMCTNKHKSSCNILLVFVIVVEKSEQYLLGYGKCFKLVNTVYHTLA